MRSALADRDLYDPPQPPGITVVKIDPETGEAARPGQANAIFEYFLSENAPQPAAASDIDATPTDDTDLQAVDLF